MLNEYKIVLVCSNSSAVIDVHDKFKCMVFTLGSKSWRESTTPPDTLPVMTVSTGITLEKKRVIVSRMSFSRSAAYVGGALYWRVLTRDRFGGGFGGEENQETEMLLCFDIHHEQFQLIALPLECELKIKTGTTTITTEQEQQLIDHRLLEFEGSPCIVRLQICEQQQTNSSNCCCKVHLYVLKDRVNSAWSIETFDVCSDTSMIQDMSDPPPCIIATVTSATTTTTTTVTTATTIAAAAATTTSTTATSTSTRAYRPITKILCVADRVIMYWFDGACVQFYDLRRKSLKMVKYIPADPRQEVRSFTRRRPGHHWPLADDDVDTANKLIYCRRDNIDYKLHINFENCLPLKTFIPEGCTIAEEYEKWYSENKDIGDGLGFVFTNGKEGMPQFHCFSMEGSQ
ncbi:hypothetical protein MKW94_001959 [Papaver nudicaule]|uniref:F-box associated beta-propeller type 3 domain-containing protein n=1 Tax=Papaver nudicaule TaxID=74823 RepID=A0AA41V910_PAPNU|nr:hypothetical protein [Papaver nudicaule]